jgi:glycosyltransferase involved in cell wall biosynthesis
MKESAIKRAVRLTVVVPCYNEERTLQECVRNVLDIEDQHLSVEIIIVDDGSSDGSLQTAQSLASRYPQIVVLHHERNQGKGAALQTGFQHATGEFVAVQDADLEYNPKELTKLLEPLINDKADVVLGSRFLSAGAHRVLYFWHYLGNRFLTFVSNMFTDLNLTDMETCYKVFRREIIQSIEIKEKRFGFEPEIVAKVAHMRLRIYEMGISYHGRTYEEGKKIGITDGLRALYCIFHYNAPKAPLPIQFLIYLFIGGFSALANIAIFLMLFALGVGINVSIAAAFSLAAIINYLLCIALLFRHKARWNSVGEVAMYFLVVCSVGILDFLTTRLLLLGGLAPWLAKSGGCIFGLIFNFLGRRYCVFPETPAGLWKRQVRSEQAIRRLRVK